MRDFPIDSRNEIGKKKVRVDRNMMMQMKEEMLREKIREILRRENV